MLHNALLATLGATLLLALGCHHDAPPERPEPAERPPLPPASGTPIGFLIDGAADLHLTADQVAMLHQIDDDLAARLEVLDAEPSAHHRPDDAGDGSRHGGRGGGMHGGRGGGMRGGGMGGASMRGGGMGGPGGGGMGGPGRHARGHEGSDDASPSGAAQAQRIERHNAEVRDAFARAFSLMDAGQQDAARKLLESHDIDTSTLQAGPPPMQSPAESQTPTETPTPTDRMSN